MPRPLYRGFRVPVPTTQEVGGSRFSLEAVVRRRDHIRIPARIITSLFHSEDLLSANVRSEVRRKFTRDKSVLDSN